MSEGGVIAHRAAARGGTSWVWPLAVVLTLIYFLTSLVVVLNSVGNASGIVWLPSFPSWYYSAARLLYWPFGPYFALLAPLQANPAITYTTFAVASRAPFLIVPPVVWALAYARRRRRRAARTADTPGAPGTPGARGGGSGRGIGRPQLFLLVLSAVVVVLYLAVAPLRQTINGGVAALDPRDIGKLRDYLRSFGPWAPVISFVLMVLQSVAAPLPAFVITIANGLLFGAFWGVVLSWTSAMVGAALCFVIAKTLGRPVVERLTGRAPIARADAFFERYGSGAVLIARLIPIISFDVVSYAAGLTRIRLLPFLVATGIGQLPATIVYSVLGENLTTGSRAGLWAVGALLSLLVVGVLAKSHLDRRLNFPATVTATVPTTTNATSAKDPQRA